MFPFRKQRYPVIDPLSAGFFKIPNVHISPDSIGGDDQLCIQIDFPTLPDFESIAKALAKKAITNEGFHQQGISVYTDRLISDCMWHMSSIDQCADRLKAELETTYKASIKTAIVAYEEQLNNIMRSNFGIALINQSLLEDEEAQC